MLDVTVLCVGRTQVNMSQGDGKRVGRALFGPKLHGQDYKNFEAICQPIKYKSPDCRFLRYLYVKRSLLKQEVLCGNWISLGWFPTVLKRKPAEARGLRSKDGQAQKRRANQFRASGTLSPSCHQSPAFSSGDSD